MVASKSQLRILSLKSFFNAHLVYCIISDFIYFAYFLACRLPVTVGESFLSAVVSLVIHNFPLAKLFILDGSDSENVYRLLCRSMCLKSGFHVLLLWYALEFDSFDILRWHYVRGVGHMKQVFRCIITECWLIIREINTQMLWGR